MPLIKLSRILVYISGALLMACSTAYEKGNDISIPAEFTTTTTDGVVIHGYNYMGDLDVDAPLILLFHQGGSNGRAEYEPIAKWLNAEGFRAVAWDQRSGGDNYYGGINQTNTNLAEGIKAGYCDAAPDLQAALDYVVDQNWADNVIIWGSSYSAALVFGLAKDNPDRVTGVVAFSPASGGPLKVCRARMWAKDVTAPMLVMRPNSEMQRDSSKEQRRILEEANVQFMVVENGIHGSSMLIDERTEHDMNSARNNLLSWLKKYAK